MSRERFRMPLLALVVGAVVAVAGMSRAFLASVAFAFEATRSTSTFGPLLLGCAFAVLVSRLLMKESIMTEKLAREGFRVPEDYEPDLFATTPVSTVMNRTPLTVPPPLLLSNLLAKAGDEAEPLSKARIFPIVGENRILRGIISRSELLEIIRSSSETQVGEVAIREPHVIHPDESLADAANRMLLHGIGRLPVVEREARPVLVGLFPRQPA